MKDQIKLINEWEYDEDTGNLMCRCPECGGRMPIYLWTYVNPYHYCPYCGEKLEEGRFCEKYKQVYSAEGFDHGRAETLRIRLKGRMINE